jgi:chromatin segregation and condensation protein Rec8/ScpA/Scc1 (kleisin family)
MSSLEPGYIDPVRINWNTIDKTRLSEIKTYIRYHLTQAEINKIDLRILGNILVFASKALSITVNTELLEPISKWLNDPNWMQRFSVHDEQCYDWALYKRKQRKWTIQQKRLAAERLKLFRQEITRLRNFRSELSQVIGRSNPKESAQIPLQDNFIEQIVSPFNPSEQHRQETIRQFGRALSLSVSDILPWKLLIISELTQSYPIKKINELKKYFPENKKRDTVSKLIHLLELEKNGELVLSQEEPFGDIIIHSTQNLIEATITVTDQDGYHYHFDWLNLNSKQRAMVVNDIKKCRIICKNVDIK